MYLVRKLYWAHSFREDHTIQCTSPEISGDILWALNLPLVIEAFALVLAMKTTIYAIKRAHLSEYKQDITIKFQKNYDKRLDAIQT